jgi:hypothetical protein
MSKIWPGLLSLLLIITAGCTHSVRQISTVPVIPINQLTIFYSSDTYGEVEPCG